MSSLSAAAKSTHDALEAPRERAVEQRIGADEVRAGMSDARPSQLNPVLGGPHVAMLKKLLVVTSAVVMASTLYGAEPHRLGPLGHRLTSEDIAAITAFVANVGAPSAIEGWRSQVLPSVWYVDVFLEPTSSTEMLRRGQVVHLQCSPQAEAGTCGIWRSAGAQGSYAQVAEVGSGFGHRPLTSASRERPIRVVGEFSDAELLSLVSYIRSSPTPHSPSGLEGMTLSGEVPITDVQREANGSAQAWLSAAYGVGFNASFRRSKGRWVVTEVVGGVA
jgi:hypothetical protein